MSEFQRGTTYGYSVEARVMSRPSVVINGVEMTGEWSRLHFPESLTGDGVPAASHFAVRAMRFFDHEGAQALRWWFMAKARADDATVARFETRLVRHKVTYSVEEARMNDGCIAASWAEPLDDDEDQHPKGNQT